eukprot:13931895-Alexandrium_andersonii.AAC.1
MDHFAEKLQGVRAPTIDLMQEARAQHQDAWQKLSVLSSEVLPSFSELRLLARSRNPRKAHGVDAIP